MNRILFVILIVALTFLLPFSTAQAQIADAKIRILDKNGAETNKITDGNSLQLQVTLPAKVNAASPARFFLDGIPDAVAACTIPAGSAECKTESFNSLGWRWNPGGEAVTTRIIRAEVGGAPQPGSAQVEVAPRPVVMVHGFISSAETWINYLGPGGYLATLGLPGFAVGDGQTPGTLNTGLMTDPSLRTNTIAQNAEIMGQYISGVQKITGAEKVDLLVHSMGGMISRYYLDRVMNGRNIGQLIILGTPNAGSACVSLAAALGFYLPGSLEILPEYMEGIFNQQITRRHGVPFYALAGTYLLEPVSAPCTGVPSDTVVSFESLNAITLQKAEQSPLMHHELTGSAEVFRDFVRPLLQNPPGDSFNAPEPGPATNSAPMQFTRIYTGHVNPGENAQVTINIDTNVAVASFALFDDTHSLEVSVQGASGKTIQLDPVKNGLIKVEDPEALVYLGYGFKQPKPGKWVVTLLPTASTPAKGADFALSARFDGGAQLRVEPSTTLPALDTPMSIHATLTADGSAPAIDSARALLRKPDGSTETIDLLAAGSSYTLTYTPSQTGLYAAEISVSAQQDGLPIDRAAFITFEVQPPPQSATATWLKVAALGLGLLLAIILIILGGFRLARKRK